MPALPPAPNVLKVQLRWTLQGSHGGGSRFFLLYTGGPPTDANLDTLATDLATAYTSDMAGVFADGTVLDQIIVTDLSSPTAAIGTWSGTIAGTLSGTALPVEIAGNFHSVIARRYRGGRPKIFLPVGVAASVNSDEDTWTSSAQASFNAAWVAFKTAIFAFTGIGCTITEHVNVSYYKGFASVQNPVTLRWRNIPTPRAADATVDVITSTTVQPTLSQQRRRRLEPVP